MEKNGSELELPGFRFHPTEEELLDFYLRRRVSGKRLNFEIIATVNLYRHDPWELPGLAKIGEKEWYFFVPRDRKQSNGGRPNRTTERGFWKATGSDRCIRSAADPKRLIGLKKTLVYYQGRAPRGTKTDWVMNEYRLPDEPSSSSSVGPFPSKEDIVLCKVYRKATTLKELEQRAAFEEANSRVSQCIASIMDSVPSELNHQGWALTVNDDHTKITANTEEIQTEVESWSSVVNESSSNGLPEIEAQNYNPEWSLDPFLNQLRSPWADQWSPYANVLHF